MKKNITINLCGRLYAIDEDAYEQLNHYTETLRAYFKRQEGGDEIVDDIEERIAELFDELKANGSEAITIEHLQVIIERIGQLKDITSTEEETEEPKQEKQNKAPETDTSASVDETIKKWYNGLKDKHFYRDSQDRIVAGVLSGCASFFGGSPLIWRIAFILVTICGLQVPLLHKLFHINQELCHLLPILLYILMALLAPETQTPEDRLKMKGKQVNRQTLSAEITESMKEHEKEKEKHQTPNPINNMKGCLSQIFVLFGKVIQTIVLVLGTLWFIPCIVIFCALVAYTFAPDTILNSMMNANEALFFASHRVLFSCWGFFAILSCFIPAFCSLHCALSSWKKISPMNYWQRIIWAAAWVLAVAVFTTCCFMVDRLSDIRHEQEYEAYREANMHEGVFFDEVDWEFFKQGGWKLIKHKHLNNDSYTDAGEYYTGSENMRYLNAYSHGRCPIYQVERADSVTPGIYRLTAVARCSKNDNGVFIYALSKEDKHTVKRLTPVPAYGYHGMGEETDTVSGLENQKNYLGKGWSLVSVDSIAISTPQNVRYGISSDESFTGSQCTASWFSAADFKLVKVGELPATSTKKKP